MHSENILLEMAKQNKTQDVLRLISSESDCMVHDSDGNTVLHLAVKHKNRDMIEAALKTGMNEHIKNFEGKSPVDLVDEHKDGDLSTWFIQCSRAIRLAELKQAQSELKEVQKDIKVLNERLNRFEHAFHYLFLLEAALENPNKKIAFTIATLVAGSFIYSTSGKAGCLLGGALVGASAMIFLPQQQANVPCTNTTENGNTRKPL